MQSGYAEAAAGFGIITGSIATGGIIPAIVGGIAGTYLLLDGADHFVGGMQQVFSGNYRDSMISQGLQHLGIPDFVSSIVEIATSRRFSKLNSVAKVEQSIVNKVVNEKSFKPLNERNYRENLKILTGTNPPSNIHAHHVFPKQFRDDFIQKNINIHDPKYLTWWEKTSHQSGAKQYNDIWKKFFADHPGANKEQVLEYGREIMNIYGNQVNF